MTNEQDFNKRKQKLINSYMEYITNLNSLKFADLSDLEQFREMSHLHSKSASASMAFSEYLRTYFSGKNT